MRPPDQRKNPFPVYPLLLNLTKHKFQGEPPLPRTGVMAPVTGGRPASLSQILDTALWII